MNWIKKIAIVLIIIFVSFIGYSFAQTKTCKIEEMKIAFICPKNTVVQYWPDIFNLEHATVRMSKLPEPQTSDELFYEEGFVIHREKIEDPDIKTGLDWIRSIEAEQEKNLEPGMIPIAGLTLNLLDDNPDQIPNWEGAVLIDHSEIYQSFVVVKDGYRYMLSTNDSEKFSQYDIDLMLKTLRWTE